MIGCVVVSDRGARHLPGCIDNLGAYLGGSVPVHIVDDRDHRLGLAGAVQTAWAYALDAGWTHLLHWEEDFRIDRPVPVDDMQWILDRAPHLAQVVLKRQPVNGEEVMAGGIIECHPDDYTECHGLRQSCPWTEHTRIFSLNPCLIPRAVLQLGWPEGNEAAFTQTCVDAGYRFAFYGAKDTPPMVEHVGHTRAAGWRL